MPIAPYIPTRPRLKQEEKPHGVVEELVSLLERFRGARFIELIISGPQGIGKSRILAALAVELKRRGFSVWYDMSLPPAAAQYDYVLLDDFAAYVHATEHASRLGRVVRKMEILIREIARYGMVMAAPRSEDILAQMRDKSYVLELFTPQELGQYYECDLVGVLINAELEGRHAMIAMATLGRIARPKVLCIRWSAVTHYNTPEWRQEYERVQAKRKERIAELYAKYARELEEDEDDEEEDIAELLVKYRDNPAYIEIAGDVAHIKARLAKKAGLTLKELCERLGGRYVYDNTETKRRCEVPLEKLPSFSP